MLACTKIVAAGVCAAAAVTGGVVAGVAADAAAPAAATKTIKLVVANTAQKSFGKSGKIAVLDQVDKQHGKVVGYDVLRAQYGAKTGTLVGVIALRGGTFDVTLTARNSPTIKGTITGGSGAYRGATGSVTAQEATAKQATVVLTYRT